MVSVLFVETTGSGYTYEGEDAKNVCNAINNAGVKGAEWTTPVKLSSGFTVVFVLKNIVCFGFR